MQISHRTPIPEVFFVSFYRKISFKFCKPSVKNCIHYKIELFLPFYSGYLFSCTHWSRHSLLWNDVLLNNDKNHKMLYPLFNCKQLQLSYMSVGNILATSLCLESVIATYRLSTFFGNYSFLLSRRDMLTDSESPFPLSLLSKNI